MKIYAMNEDNHVLHNSWEEALEYYKKLVGENTFEEQRDSYTEDEIELDDFTVRIETELGELKGTVKQLMDKGEIIGPEYFALEY